MMDIQINCVFQLTGKLIWWFIISLLPKEWPDIFFNNNGLSISKESVRIMPTNMPYAIIDKASHIQDLSQ